MQQNDHDLLVELRTEFKGMRADIRDLKEDLARRVSDLETDKESKKESATIHKDHENRIRRLERWSFIVIGALLLLEAFLKYKNF